MGPPLKPRLARLSVRWARLAYAEVFWITRFDNFVHNAHTKG